MRCDSFHPVAACCLYERLPDAHDAPMAVSPEDYPPEELTPELRALVATALVWLLALVLGAGYVAVRVTQWLL